MDKCQKDETLRNCNCSYEPCSRKGVCCECLQYHLKSNELPGCLFPPEVEKTYDRSMATFVELYQQGNL